MPRPAEPRFRDGSTEEGHIFDGQLLAAENLLAMQVGDRDFGRGQVDRVVALAAVELFFELWQLGGTHQRLGVDQQRRIDLRVAVFTGVQIEQEVNQHPLQGAPEPVQRAKALPVIFVARGRSKTRNFSPQSDVGLRREIIWDGFSPQVRTTGFCSAESPTAHSLMRHVPER